MISAFVSDVFLGGISSILSDFSVAIGIFLSFFIRETYCESQATAAEENMFNTEPVIEFSAEPQVEAAKS